MVFKKPYAFFIKYFKVINLILCVLNVFLIYKMNLLHITLNNVYYGKLTNFINMDNTYIGFIMFFLIFIISLIILIIILTLMKKEKPFKDYLYNLIYNIILFAYFISVSNLFLQLNNVVIEQTTLKLYSDISFIVLFPLVYFIIKYVMIVIGFSINKFNFQKDIIELKQTDEDNEEIELIFSKNTYKTKRKMRKIIREFKYYVIENKFVVSIICLIILIISIVSLFSINFFDKSIVSVGEKFVADNFMYEIMNVYETKYDSRYKVIKEDSKFVVVILNVTNNMNLGKDIDFKKIRLFYGNEYVYSNNFYNKFFYDFTPYDGEILKSGETKKYAFIFKVPSNYKSNNYTLKFYDRIVYTEEDTIGSYKKININSKNFDKEKKEILANLNENTSFNKNLYGESNITINNYSLENKYLYTKDNQTIIIRDANVNNILLIIDYKLNIDEKSKNITINNAQEFFENHVNLEYKINNISKNISNIKVIESLNEKIFISVPYNIKEAQSINLIISFRNENIKYLLK